MMLGSNLQELSQLATIEPILGSELLERLVGEPVDSIRDAIQQGGNSGVSEKVAYLSKIVDYLQGKFNQFGVQRWFERVRAMLKGENPLSYLGPNWRPGDDKADYLLELAQF